MTENEKLHYFKQLLITQQYSMRTVKAYTQCVKSFFLWYTKTGDSVDDKVIVQYLTNLVDQNKAPKTINLYKESLKTYFLLLYNHTFRVSLKLSREPRTLPVVLSTQEIKRIIDSLTNIKHKLLISLSYGC